MKKSKFLLLTLLLVMALSVALVGCGGEPAGEEPVAGEPAVGEPVAEEPVVPEETPTIDRIVEAGKLVMLTNAAFPPFEYLGDDNQVAGVDADIAKAVADEIGVELEIVDMDFDGIILALQQGKGNLGVAGMTATDERRESVDFSINYVDAAQVIIVRENDTSITGADGLEGKSVGVQLGTTGDIFVTDETAANVQRYKTGADASMELSSGKIDAVVIDEMPANEIVAASTGLVVLEEPLTEEQYAIAIAKGQEDLVAVVDKVVAEMLESGEIEALIEQHKAATE